MEQTADKNAFQLPRFSPSGLRIIGICLGVLSIGFAIAFVGYLLSTSSTNDNTHIAPTPTLQYTGS